MPYTAAAQARAAEELSGLAPDSVLARMIEDYGELRARLRAACPAR